jgi:hypothetical protein
LSPSQLDRDSEEIDPPHILRFEPSLTRSNFCQNQAEVASSSLKPVLSEHVSLDARLVSPEPPYKQGIG